MKPTRYLSLLVVILILGTSLSAQRFSSSNPPVNTDGPAANLVKTCQSTVGDYFAQCEGFLSGIVFGIDAANSNSETREICFPGMPPELRRSIDVFASYVERHPDDLNQHIGHVAYAAFLEAFPCDTSKPSAVPNNAPTGAYLAKVCQSYDGPDISLCRGMVSGIEFGIDAANAKSKALEICLPAVPMRSPNTPFQLFMKYVESHRDNLNEPVGYVLYTALREAYPCQKQ